MAPAAKAPTIEGMDVEGDLAASENPKPVACCTSAACDLETAIVKLVIEQIACDGIEVTICIKWIGQAASTWRWARPTPDLRATWL